MVWACIENRRRIRREESDGDGGAGEKKEVRPKRGVCIASITTCRRENCRERTRKTGLNGGVSLETSTPHNSGKYAEEEECCPLHIKTNNLCF